MLYAACFFAGLVLGVLLLTGVVSWNRRRHSSDESIASLLRQHLPSLQAEDIAIFERRFPFRVRVDLQRALDRWLEGDVQVRRFCGIHSESSFEGITLTACMTEHHGYPPLAVPPSYEDIDVGASQPSRVLRNGLWILETAGHPVVVLMARTGRFETSMLVQVQVSNTPEAQEVANQMLASIDDWIKGASTYRGKILTLEEADDSYSGRTQGVKVQQLRAVERNQIVLPEKTLELLERNVIQFVKNRDRLRQFQQTTQKGLLFYGPPGTGKTHTIHYLTQALPGHTTLLISAEQVALLDEYMTLARLLQPSVVVLEDVDLIARDRTDMNSPCEEALLNKLLNEMDGLKEDAEILFILTTNRPEALEAALASRPGRVDQAIEFPLPDDDGRAKLVRLYSQGMNLAEDCIEEVVRRTEGVSAAFIKELMRRSVQFHLEANGSDTITSENIDQALNEMLLFGGSLNLKLLGASTRLEGAK